MCPLTDLIRRLLRAAALASLVLLPGACGTDEGYTPGDFTIPAGHLRIVNMIPDSPPLNAQINESFANAIDYGTSTSLFNVLPDIPQRLTISYQQAGNTVPVLTADPFSLENDDEHTVVMAGTLDNPTLVHINTSASNSIPDGQIELQFLNVLTNDPTLFLLPVSSAIDLSLLKAGAEVQRFSLDFGEITDPFTTPPGDYEIKVTDTASGAPLWDSGDFSLSAGARGLALVVNHFGPGTGVRMLSIDPQGTTKFANEQLSSAMRIANMTADRGPLDIYVDGVPFAQNVAFGELTNYIEQPAGQIAVKVTPTGEPATLLIDSLTLTATTGEFLTLALTGNGSSNVAQLFFDSHRLVPSRAQLTVIHTAPSLGTLDFYLVSPGTAIGGVNTKLKFSGLTVIPSAAGSQRSFIEEGSYDMAVTSRDNPTDIVYGPERVDLSNNGIYSIYITDTAGGGEPLAAVFADDFNP